MLWQAAYSQAHGFGERRSLAGHHLLQLVQLLVDGGGSRADGADARLDQLVVLQTGRAVGHVDGAGVRGARTGSQTVQVIAVTRSGEVGGNEAEAGNIID